MTFDQDVYDRVRRRARELRWLYLHLVVYSAVIVMLFMINATGTDADQGNWWVIYPAAGWGVVLVIHLVVTATGGFSRWEDRQVESLLRRERQRELDRRTHGSDTPS